MQIVAAILRFAQIVFFAVVLGLSVSLAKGQATKAYSPELDDSVPATTAYSSFVGGFGMLVALVGIVSLFVEFLQGIVMLVLDGLLALTSVAGGIAVAVGLRGVSCGNAWETFNNDLLNGGCNGKSGDDKECRYGSWPTDTTGTLKSRCQMDEADSAFMFLGFVVCVGLLVHTFWFGGRTSMGKRTTIV